MGGVDRVIVRSIPDFWIKKNSHLKFGLWICTTQNRLISSFGFDHRPAPLFSLKSPQTVTGINWSIISHDSPRACFTPLDIHMVLVHLLRKEDEHVLFYLVKHDYVFISTILSRIYLFSLKNTKKLKKNFNPLSQKWRFQFSYSHGFKNTAISDFDSKITKWLLILVDVFCRERLKKLTTPSELLNMDWIDEYLYHIERFSSHIWTSLRIFVSCFQIPYVSAKGIESENIKS